MTELFINQKLNQLVELDYDSIADDPLDYAYEGFEFFIETEGVVNKLIENLFDGDEDAYQDEHDKYTNTTDLFEGLNKIAKEQGKLIYPVTKYQHSMVKYYLGSDHGWEYSVNGFVLVDVEQAKKGWGLTSKTAIENYLDGQLGAFTNYANGDVYSAIIYHLNSTGEKDEDLDQFGNIQPEQADLEGLFELGFLEGDLKDWKEARENIQTSYQAID